jgi:acetolactate synthase-1/2/3 large subunit
MKLSEFLVKYLFDKGVTHVFELSGGMIANFLEAFYEFKKIEVISMHHEQGVSFAVDGFSRIANFPAIGLATSGPGAINLLTGIGSCYFDSVPAIFITGQVNMHENKGERLIRQLGFQETDIVSMVKPICKAVYKLESAGQFPQIIEEAFNIALSGRPGPVLIDIPMNLQGHDVSIENAITCVENVDSNNKLDISLWDKLNDKISKSIKPLILAGRGVNTSNSRDLLVQFAEKTNIPIVTSILGLDVIHYDHPLRAGFIGTYGNRWANTLLGECDLLIVLGSRLDIRQTGADVNFFASRDIIHIDIDSHEINNRVKNCFPIVADIHSFLTMAVVKIETMNISDRGLWFERFIELKEKYPDLAEIATSGIHPNSFLHTLSKASQKVGAYIADVGNHQMWCAQSLEINKGQYFLTSGGMGAMGYSLPASIGACFALNKPVISISGDGGFQLNIQELQTIVRNNLPVKIVVLNNKSLGMIRQFQECYFNSHYQSSIWGYSCPDFEQIANAYTIKSKTIKSSDEIDEGIKAMWENPEEPFLLQVMLDPFLNCYPKIAFGKPLTEMEPLSQPIELEGT